MKKILFVDDEPSVLKSLKRVFIDSEYETNFADCGDKALSIMADELPDMIVTDMKMPQMDGYKLLKTVEKRYPSVIRIVLSGYSEKNEIVNTIYDETARAYLTKPWNNKEFINRIGHFFSIHDTICDNNLVETIDRIGKLPVLPEIYTQIIALVKSGADIGEIARCIEKEPVYVAKLLSVVNSSYYGVNIGTVKQAISYLGLETTEKVILCIEIFDNEKYASDQLKFISSIWVHSNAVDNVFSRIYEEIYNRPIPESIGACGLLHDIGYLLIPVYYQKQFSEIAAKFDKINIVTTENENIIYGTDHAKLGAYLLNWWNLPESLVEICLFHHNPLDNRVGDQQAAALMNIIDYYSLKMEGAYLQIDEPDDAIFKIAGTEKEKIVNELDRYYGGLSNANNENIKIKQM